MDVGQFVDIFDAALALKTKAWKPGVIVVSSSALNATARDHFPRIGDIGRGDLVHSVGGYVAPACARRRHLRFE
jgi:hypothetical protein